MKHVEAVIFDWAGTTVDYGCMAPMHAMKQAFLQQNIAVSLDEIRQPMGMLKMDHIKAILNMERVKNHFNDNHGRLPEPADCDQIYAQFEKNIMANLHQHTNVIDGMLSVQDHLRHQNIKMGSTTGYTKEMINIVASSAKEQGYEPDYIVSADLVKRGRPYPYMLYQNLVALDVLDVRSVIKVGDTVVDILEGLNAGCWTVGVVKGSSMLGLSEEEAANLSQFELNQQIKNVKYQMLSAGADYVIDSIEELPWAITLIQAR
jgi:phosphonoacetaldehyde hydrolase